MHLQEYDHVINPANQAARPTKPTPNIIPLHHPQHPSPREGRDSHKVDPTDRTAQHQSTTRQASEGEVPIHFMSRYDVWTYYHPLTIELVQKNKLRIPQLLLW